MLGCEKKFLYEVEAPGLLYLTLDNHGPVYVGFHHRCRLEIRLMEGGRVHDDDDDETDVPMKENLTSLTDPHIPLDERSVLLYVKEESFGDAEREVATDEVNQNTVNIVSGTKKESEQISDDPGTREEGDTKQLAGSLYAGGVEREDSFSEGKKKARRGTHRTSKSELGLVRKANMPMAKKSERYLGVVKLKGQEKDKSRSKSAVSKTIQAKNKSPRRSVSPVSDESTDSLVLEGNQSGEYSSCGTDKIKKKKVKTVTCAYCSATFACKNELFRHRKLKGENLHKCEECGKMFQFRAYLLVHMKCHSGETKSLNTCDECGQKNKNVTEFKKHMISHTGEHVYKCCRCPRTFLHHHNWRSHMTMHRAPGYIKCSCCDQMFPSRAALSEHKMSLLEIKCGLCGQVFPNRASRVIHFKSEHEDTILRCPVCDRMYSTEAELQEHVVKHSRRPRKQCPTCGRMVTNLRNHVLTHRALEEMAEADLWMCDKCPNKFKTKATLLNHMKTNHSAERSKCHLCFQTFKSYKGLYRHLNNVHSNLMPYQCEICGKRSKLKSNLKIHMRTHSSSKMFPCSLCNQAFNYKSSLNGHMRSKHSTENVSAEAVVPSSSTCETENCIPDSAVTAWSTSGLSRPAWDGNTGRQAWDVPARVLPVVTDFSGTDTNLASLQRYCGDMSYPQV